MRPTSYLLPPTSYFLLLTSVLATWQVLSLHARYREVYGAVLQHPTAWGAAGHIAWALSKNEGDDLSVDKIYRVRAVPAWPLAILLPRAS